VLFASALDHCSAQDSGASAKAVEVSEIVMAKRLDHVVAPKLPVGAIGKCSNAMVMLKVTIDENGKVSDDEFVSGYDELKDSAMTAIRQWTYKPYEQRGNAIAVQTRASIFYLGDGESFPVYSPDVVVTAVHEWFGLSLQNFRIDGPHSNAYTGWKQMGSPQKLTTEEYAKLKAEEGLQLLGAPTWLDVSDGAVHVSTALPRQSVSLLALSW
jgi:hypothetical protein